MRKPILALFTLILFLAPVRTPSTNASFTQRSFPTSHAREAESAPPVHMATTALSNAQRMGDAITANRVKAEAKAAAAKARRAKLANTPKRTTVRAAAVEVSQGPMASPGYDHQCGGNLPPCSVLNNESGGNLRLWNGQCKKGVPTYYPVGYTGNNPCGSTASGKWQFLRSTWNGYGGYVNAADAPADVQNAKAAELWAGGRGCSHWNAC